MDAEPALGCSFLIVLVLALFGHPFIIDQWVQPNLSWYPNFTYWQFFLIFFISTILGVQTSNSKSEK